MRTIKVNGRSYEKISMTKLADWIYNRLTKPEMAYKPKLKNYTPVPHTITPAGTDIHILNDMACEIHGGWLAFAKKFQGREHTRELVRIRDNHTCQICQRKQGEQERNFDIHHLNGLCGFKSRTYDRVKDIDGLITLCHKCHIGLEEVRYKMANKLSPRSLKNKEYQAVWRQKKLSTFQI